jgi:integrase
VLPAKSQIHSVKPHEALPYQQIPAFMAELRKREGLPARALEFTILNANRTGEVRNARWDEIDFEKKIWFIPSDRMKGGKEHRVPLQGRGLDILKSLPREKGNPFIFFGDKAGQPIGERAMSLLVDRMTDNGFTVHGFRSSFKDWCAEQTNYADAISERCLAHTEKDKVKAAYQRGDMIEKRRQVMAAWGRYCATMSAAGSGEVLALHEARA